MMYSMKEACIEANMTYETLKFYCNQGLIPGVRRDRNNYRVFDENAVAWIKSLTCLKNCDLSIAEMKEYLALCLEGPSSIPTRQQMLEEKRAALEEKKRQVQEALDYIDWKQGFYRNVLSGKIPYQSNLIASQTEDESAEEKGA